MKKQNQLLRIGMLFCLSIGMLLTANPARAATLLVCKGSGGITCTYSTITAAVAAAAPGDTIHVAAATYPEFNIHITKNLTITGAGSGSVTVDADQNGRVFSISSGVTATISGMTITNGRLIDLAGAGIASQGDLTLDDIVVMNCMIYHEQHGPEQAGIGGGIYSEGNLTMTKSQVTNNVSFFHGGGIYLDSTTDTHLTNVLIDDNATGGGSFETGTGNGGGIYLASSAANLVLNQVTVNHNLSVNNGGGIYAAQSATLTIQNSTISNNIASADGAGLYAEASSNLTMANDTVAGNFTAAGSGGGIYVVGTANLTNVTVADNTAQYYGGLLNFRSVATIFLSNTILSDNTSPDCYGGFYSYDDNLIQNAGACIITGQTANNIYGVSANLAALADNGGPTNTMALLPGSPAIDAGKNSLCAAAVGYPNYGAGGLDQRGVTRPQGAQCDIGAYEGFLHWIYLPLVMR